MDFLAWNWGFHWIGVMQNYIKEPFFLLIRITVYNYVKIMCIHKYLNCCYTSKYSHISSNIKLVYKTMKLYKINTEIKRDFLSTQVDNITLSVISN